MVCTYCQAIDFILPVRIGSTQLAVSVIIFTFPYFFYKSAKFVTIHHVERFLYITKRNITIVRHTRFGTCLPFFGSNDDNTIGCTRTIDSSCRSIFQHRKALNVIRIHHRQRIGQALYAIIVHSQTVNYNQRIIFGRKRRTATYANRSAPPRSTTIGNDAYTGYLTGHHILCVRGQAFVQFIWFDSCYGTGSIIFFHSTVTDYHYFIQ